jgi:DNA-binding NtrC family response regulator
MISINNTVIDDETIPLPKSMWQEINHSRSARSHPCDCVVGVSRHVMELKQFISARAASPHPILLIGERGLRQEQVARALHEAGATASQPFITVNTYTLSEERLYQLLFGHNNVFDAAGQGTVFLNGLVSLPGMIQPRLAVFLEEMKWRMNREGTRLPRLVISTDWNQAAIKAENRIGYSLVELLRPHSFAIKPLRERSEDIGPLAGYLLNRLVTRLQTGKYELTHETIKALADYHWERNIDELEAVLEGALAQAQPQRIDINLLPKRIQQANFNSLPPSGVDLPQIIDNFERTLIETALRQTKGNQTKAARLLGLKVQTLNMKLKRFQMHTFGVESSESAAHHSPAES